MPRDLKILKNSAMKNFRKKIQFNWKPMQVSSSLHLSPGTDPLDVLHMQCIENNPGPAVGEPEYRPPRAIDPAIRWQGPRYSPDYYLVEEMNERQHLPPEITLRRVPKINQGQKFAYNRAYWKLGESGLLEPQANT